MKSPAALAVILAASAASLFAAASPAAGFLGEVASHFPAWDSDHDGKLSFAEIDVACADPKFKGPTAAAAATLRNVAKLRGLTLPEYTEALTPAAAGEKANGYEAAYAAALKKLTEMNREMFPAGLPKGEQLAQGKLGDCFLLAGVGTMAQVQPERLKSMVESLPDGMTAINFGNGQRVVLPAPTDAEVIIGATTRGDGVWANVFEKAIGDRYIARQTKAKAVTPFAYIGRGGTPDVPLGMLTGHKLKREGCEMFQKPGLDDAGKAKRLDEIRDALEAAFTENRLVIGGTGDISGKQTKVHGIYYAHSYGVLGYDRATDVVRFWNPMSNLVKVAGEPGLQNGYPTSFGRFDCPLKEAVMWFGSFTVEQAEKVPVAAEK